MASPGKLRIEIVEDPTAPPHRRWVGTVELPDGRAGRIHAAAWSEVWECAEGGVFVDRACEAPGCLEECTSMDHCMGCGAVVCPVCNVDLDVLTPHRPDVHWRHRPGLPVDVARGGWVAQMRDAATVLESARDERRLRMGAEALRIARQQLPEDSSTVPVRTSAACVMIFVDRVLEQPDIWSLHTQLGVALEQLRSRLDLLVGESR